MSFKRPVGDDKTAPHRPGAAGSERPGSGDEDKTAYIDKGRIAKDAKTQFAHLDDKDPGDGSAQNSRLPWPARDKKPDDDSRLAGAKEAARSNRDHERDYSASDDQKTKLFATPKNSAQSENSVPDDRSAEVRSDPVVGWVVIISGPGKGVSLELGAGANSVGRDPNQKVCIDFGDPEIHREKHATIVYDPKSRRFFLQSGDTRNLTYLGDTVVLSPTELMGGEIITLGQTQLRFVPFCGKEFSWL